MFLFLLLLILVLSFYMYIFFSYCCYLELQLLSGTLEVMSVELEDNANTYVTVMLYVLRIVSMLLTVVCERGIFLYLLTLGSQLK